MKVITLDEAREAVHALAAEHPDQTNGGLCQYARLSDEDPNVLVPNCIVGHVLAKLDCALVITDDEGEGNTLDLYIQNIVTAGVGGATDGFGWSLQPDACEYLDCVQAYADNRQGIYASTFPLSQGTVPWRAAVAMGDELYAKQTSGAQ